MSQTKNRIKPLCGFLISIILLIALTIPVVALEGIQQNQGTTQGLGNMGNNSNSQTTNPQNQQQGSANQQGGQNQGSEKPNSGSEQQHQNQNNQSQNGYRYQYHRHQYRYMNCTGEHNRSRIRSQWQVNNTKDAFEIEFFTEPEPTIIFYYTPTGEASDILLTFELTLEKIIEFTDLNQNQRYDFSDLILSTYTFNAINFTNITYTYENTSNDTTRLYMNTHTIDNVFSLDLLIANNFTALSNQLLSPAEMKIDFTIINYPYVDTTAPLALLLTLETDHNLSVTSESFDEKQGYASNESALNISSKHYSGFLSWINTVLVDGTIKPVQTSILKDSYTTDETIEQTQYISFTYPHGTEIIHDPKIGVISQSFNLDATSDIPFINTITELNIYATYAVSILLALILFLGVVTIRKRI